MALTDSIYVFERRAVELGLAGAHVCKLGESWEWGPQRNVAVGVPTIQLGVCV